VQAASASDHRVHMAEDNPSHHRLDAGMRAARGLD